MEDTIEASSIPVMRLPERLLPLRETAFRQELKRAITAMFRPAVILDLPSNAKLDAQMIDFLIRSARDAAEHDAEAALAVSNPEHIVFLELTRISAVIPAFRSTDEAAAHLEKSRKPKSGSFARAPESNSAPSTEPAPEAPSQS